MKKLVIATICILAFSHVTTRAQDFVYTPVNPAFGGNPYNYSWLLGQAEAQNSFEEPEEVEEEDPLNNFQEDLNNQILNEITRQLYQNQFGEQGLTEGFYRFGSYEIDVSPISEGMQIRIIDIYTGSETTVIVPYY
ncbi:MAG: curli assembly protein CsgF [Bacteroidales bacterium]|nr:curli assembly protein CsgF [Bacteroidales bacterium]